MFPFRRNKPSFNHQSCFIKSFYYRYFIRIFCWQFTFVQMLHFRLKFLYCHLLHFRRMNDQFESKVPNRTKNEFGHDQFWLYSSRGWYVKPCISAHILVFKTILFATSDTTQRRELGVWPTFNLQYSCTLHISMDFKIKAWFQVSDQPVNECSSPPRFLCVTNAQRPRKFLSSFLHRGKHHINSS